MGRLPLEREAINHLLDALEALKQAEYENDDARNIWCPDWTRSSSDASATAETKAQVAKVAISNMKLVVKTLATLSDSLSGTIKLVTIESSQYIHAVSLTSLPDDLLARIFELCCMKDPDDRAPSPGVDATRLASVSQRFRLIAIHLPSLWQDTCTLHKTKWVLTTKSRCSNPFVFVRCDYEWNPDKISAFLRLLIHPSSQWKGLSFHSYARYAHHFFEEATAASGGGNFDSMETLRLYLVWYDADMPSDEAQIDILPSTHLSTSDSALLSSWRLPSLREIDVTSLIPPVLDCPNLRTCKIDLDRHGPRHWNLDAFKQFLQAISHVESLSLSFDFTPTLSQYHTAYHNTVNFPRLRFLAINVSGETSSYFLKEVMDTIVDPSPTVSSSSSLSELEVSLDYQEVADDELHSWINAIFTVGPSGQPRNFVNVTSFSLRLYTYPPPTTTTISELLPIFFVKNPSSFPFPRVQTLSLDLPANDLVDVIDAFLSCCAEISAIRLQNLRMTSERAVLLEVLERDCDDDGAAKLVEKLRRVEVVASPMFSKRLKEVEWLFGS